MTWLDWAGRALCLAVTFGLAYLRQSCYAPVNSLESVAIAHCLSALCNACGIIAAAVLMRGKASFDMQRLSFCAIAVNLLGFLAFAAKSSPLVSVSNTVITVISYAQLVRLLWPSNGDPIPHNRRNRFFRFAYLQGKGFYLEAKKR